MRSRSQSLLMFAVTVLLATAVARSAQDVKYVYDAAGRLIAAFAPNGDAAIYTYDAVGNLLAITRRGPTDVSVVDFSPRMGSVGTTVSIYGTGFSSTASSNSVSFNGTSATVTAASANSLTVTVPSGATTGTIAVTSPNGSANSASAFTVGSLAPTITSFTPSIAAVGVQMTVTGSNFESGTVLNRAKIGVGKATIASANTTTLEASVPASTGSGRIAITTPNGLATSSQILYVAPAPYTASDVQATATLSAGAATNVAITTATRIGLALIDQTQTQRVSLKAAPGPLGSVTIHKPDGTVLLTRSPGIFPILLEPGTLAPGVYTINVDPLGSGTGTTALTLYEVPADLTGALTFGTAQGSTLSTPGQNADYTFPGTAAQRVSLSVNSGAVTGTVKILNTDGSTLATANSGAAAGFIDTRTLGATGTHRVLVDPSEANTGSATFTLYDVPADASGTIAADGNAVSTILTTPGQNGTLTFSGTSGQRVSMRVNGSAPIGTVTMQNPSGTLMGSVSSGVITAFLEPVTLASTGNHSVKIDPTNAATGTVTTALYDVPADVSGTISAGGSSVGVTISAPGQNGHLTFSGTASQQVTVQLTNNTMGSVTVKLLKPDGTQLTSATSISASFSLATQTLPSTGTYTIVVDPAQSNTGSITVSAN